MLLAVQWWGHPELPCTPKPLWGAGTSSTLLLRPPPIPALHLSSLGTNFWEVSINSVKGLLLNPKEQNWGQDPTQSKGGKPATKVLFPPRCAHPPPPGPRKPGPPASAGAQTRQRSLGNVTPETDMTVKWGLEKLLNAGRVTRACQWLLKK